MCHLFSNPLSTLESIALPIIGTTLGGPLGGALGGAAAGALRGGGVTGALEGGALGGLGGAFSGTAGSLIPSDSILGGLNSSAISALSPVTDGISNALSGVSSAFNSGLSNLEGALGFGASPTGSALTGDYLSGVSDPVSDAARSAVSGSAISGAPASTALSGYLPSGGSALTGGGATGGFFSGANDDLLSGLSNAAPQQSISGFTPTSFDTPGFGGSPTVASQFQSTALPSNISSYGNSLIGSPANGGGASVPDNSHAPVGGSLLNSLLRGGLSYGLSQNPYSGLSGVASAAQQGAQDYQPFLNAGSAATTQLANLQGLNGQAAANTAMGSFQNAPGYQFQMQQGLNALDADAAARGQLLSGNQQRAVQTYGSGLADQSYQQYLNNLQNQASSGLTAAGGVGNMNTNAALATAGQQASNANRYNTFLGGLSSSLFPTTGSGLLSWL